MIPQTPADAFEHTRGLTPIEGRIGWQCPSYDNSYHTYETLDLGITEEEFRSSMDRDIMRTSTALTSVYVRLVDPEDRYVQMIARHIDEHTIGYSDRMRATAALNLVQTAIDYSYDMDTYGMDDFAATPLETLYLGVGDCEDSSILLMSIYLAMGYDAVLLDYPTHIAVGVRWSDDMEYRLCGTTAPYTIPPTYGLWYCGDLPDIYGPADRSSVWQNLNDGIAHYRYTVKRMTGL